MSSAEYDDEQFTSTHIILNPIDRNDPCAGLRISLVLVCNAGLLQVIYHIHRKPLFVSECSHAMRFPSPRKPYTQINTLLLVARVLATTRSDEYGSSLRFRLHTVYATIGNIGDGEYGDIEELVRFSVVLICTASREDPES